MPKDKIERNIILKNFGVALILAVGLLIAGIVVRMDTALMIIISAYVFLIYFTTMTTIIHNSRQLTEVEERILKKIEDSHQVKETPKQETL